MTQQTKDWIDKASYATLLQKWRFAPVGSELFSGETGAYYAKVMCEKRDADHDAAVNASKMIGWES